MKDWFKFEFKCTNWPPFTPGLHCTKKKVQMDRLSKWQPYHYHGCWGLSLSYWWDYLFSWIPRQRLTMHQKVVWCVIMGALITFVILNAASNLKCSLQPSTWKTTRCCQISWAVLIISSNLNPLHKIVDSQWKFPENMTFQSTLPQHWFI